MRNRKQITKVCENCEVCGVPIITCICDKLEKVKTNAKFIILSSSRELYRNTNTANLLKVVNPESTEIILWERTRPSEIILNYFDNDKYQLYLVFPDINEDLNKRRVEYASSDYIPVFIIIDGTWGEAWKIIKKSDYLKILPVLSLKINTISKFDLRRGQDEGNLCTIETAIELAKLNGEYSESRVIDNNFTLFLGSYKAGASGHKINKKSL